MYAVCVYMFNVERDQSVTFVCLHGVFSCRTNFFFFFSFLSFFFLWLSLNEIEEKKSVFLIFVVRVLVVVECDAVRCCNLGSSSGKRRREEKRGKKTSDRAVVYIKKGRPLSRPLCVCWCVCVCWGSYFLLCLATKHTQEPRVVTHSQIRSKANERERRGARFLLFQTVLGIRPMAELDPKKRKRPSLSHPTPPSPPPT